MNLTDEETHIIPEEHASEITHEVKEGTSTLALLPLKSVVILPKSILPIIVGRPSSIKAVEYALKHDKMMFISAQKDASVESPQLNDIFSVGARSIILQVMRMPNGAIKVLAEGICRARIVGEQPADGFTAVESQDMPTFDLEETVELEAAWRQLRDLYKRYCELNEKAPVELAGMVKSAHDMDYVVDTIAVHIQLTVPERQDILETVSLKERMLKLCGYMQKEIEIAEAELRIKGRIQTQVEKSQREYYLTEQIKAIQKELGRDDQATEIAHLKESLKNVPLSQEAREKVEKELHRLEQMQPLSPEAVVSRTYIDWIMSLPWGQYSKDAISISKAEEILNKNHAGLAKVKERIIEFLAAKKFAKQSSRSPILCLVGPPGVGKTSLALSIAESLGRSFARISLGGVRDEAEIRGHRRTYIGALPGKIVQAVRKSKSMNPVILLDEIDKMSKDIHGDPAAALLEVLDPEQNKSFVDHFLDIEFDLSKVMFITTANTMERIPLPLFDRMEIIMLSGYTEPEKLEIARNFLISRNLHEYGLSASQFELPDAQIMTLINYYTQEAGVRQLERLIAKLMRKAIQQLLKNKSLKKVLVTPELLKEWLGNPKFKKTPLSEKGERVGIATGLAWTEFGGDVMEIEVSVMPGKGGLTLTGQLGEVMQESAQAALSYVRSRATMLGLKPSFYANKDIHIHIPEGATPKDGPSAGITMSVALISALTKKSVKPGIAMTGEVTLQGRVLAVGGLKEKLLAARQHGIKTVFVPADNRDDIEEIEKECAITPLSIHFVDTMDELLEQLFEIKKNAAPKEELSTGVQKKAKKSRKKKN